MSSCSNDCPTTAQSNRYALPAPMPSKNFSLLRSIDESATFMWLFAKATVEAHIGITHAYTSQSAINAINASHGHGLIHTDRAVITYPRKHRPSQNLPSAAVGVLSTQNSSLKTNHHSFPSVLEIAVSTIPLPHPLPRRYLYPAS